MERIASAVVYTTLLVVIGSVSAEPFTLDCQLPFENIKKHHPIDDTCAGAGEAPTPTPNPEQIAANRLQNLTKNNFCATTPTPGPALVTFISFKKLQQKLDQKAPEAKHWWRKNLPKNREVFRDIYTTTEGRPLAKGAL